MSLTNRRPNILFLKGVKLSKLSDNTTIKPNQVSLDIFDKSPIIYKSNPTLYNGIEKWPKTTNLLCWHCNCSFVNIPKFIPTSATKDNDNKLLMDVYGNFCRWCCAAYYIKREFDLEDQGDIFKLLRILYKDMTGDKVIKFKEAIPKIEMKKYKGSSGYTEYEYSKKLLEIDNEFTHITYKISQLRE